MSIFSTLYIGTSGLEAQSDAIGVVGDDIANASTVGYKESRANFSDVIGGAQLNGQGVGAGVEMTGTQTLFGQGTLENTGRELDLAVNGNGFFVVNGDYNGQTGSFYSRDGRISVDNSGTLVNAEGLDLQGYSIDDTGKIADKVGNLTVGGESPPKATTTATMSLNLDSGAVPPAAWDPTNPSGTSNYSTSTTVYDSLGTAHQAQVYFRDQGGGNWEWHAMVDGGELAGGTAGTATEIAGGTLAFDGNGALTTDTTTASSASFTGATANQAIAFNFGDPTSTGGTGLAGTTQFSGGSSVKSVSQDGWASGDLTDLSVADDGTVTGKYSNGQDRPIARLALASFASQDGLQRVGSQLFSATNASGEAVVDKASTGTRGSISSGELETSNVDIANELVTLIAFQRAFDANSKTVQTSDQMLQEVVNLKQS